MTKQLDKTQLNEIVSYIDRLNDLQEYTIGVRSVLDIPGKIPVTDFFDEQTLGHVVFDGEGWVFEPSED